MFDPLSKKLPPKPTPSFLVLLTTLMLSTVMASGNKDSSNWSPVGIALYDGQKRDVPVKGFDLTILEAPKDKAPEHSVTGFSLGLFSANKKESTGLSLATLSTMSHKGNLIGLTVGGIQTAADHGDIDGLALSGIVSRVDEGNVNGASLSGIWVNNTKGDLNGLALGGLINHHGENIQGLGIGGLYSNVSGNLSGLSIGGGIQSTSQNTNGAQIGGLVTAAKSKVHGAAIGGLGSVTHKDLNGLSIGGIVSHTEGKGHGCSIGGLYCSARKEMKGVMIGGLWNQTNSLNGGQIGLINHSKHLRGIQLGVLNFAENGILPVCPVVNFAFTTQKENALAPLVTSKSEPAPTPTATPIIAKSTPQLLTPTPAPPVTKPECPKQWKSLIDTSNLNSRIKIFAGLETCELEELSAQDTDLAAAIAAKVTLHQSNWETEIKESPPCLVASAMALANENFSPTQAQVYQVIKECQSGNINNLTKAVLVYLTKQHGDFEG